MKKQQDEITIKELIDIFLPKVWVIALTAFVFAAILGGYSAFVKADTYTSKSTYVMVKVPTQYVDQNSNTAITTGLSAAEVEAMQMMINMAEQVLETNDFLNEVKALVVERNPEYANISVSNLKDMISIKVDGEATVFNISTTSGDPDKAYAVALVVEELLPNMMEDVFSSYSIRIKHIDAPRLPTSPNSKGTIKNAIIGALGGAVLSMLVVFVVAKLDVVVRSKEMLEDNLTIPIIGVIPRYNEED